MSEFEVQFPHLAGLLMMSFFLHNCVLPILKNQRHPQHNGRDLSLGYLLVGVSMVIVGGVAYLSFARDHTRHLATHQNFFQLFPTRSFYPLT